MQIKVSNPTLNIETNTLFKVCLVQKKITINTIIELYALVLQNRDKYGSDSIVELNGLEIHFSLTNNTIYLEKVFGRENKKYKEYKYTLTTHFFESLIDDDFQLSTLVALMIYIKKHNIDENVKHEIICDNSTIVFELDKNIIRLITGWKGTR